MKRRRYRTLKRVLLTFLVIGAISSVTVPSVFAVLSSQEGNNGNGIATGTLTMGNSNAGNSASTTLSAKVGTTTLSSAIPQTTLASNVGSTTLSADVGTTTLTQAVGTTTLAQAMGAQTTLKTAITTTNGTTVTPNSTTGYPTPSTASPFVITVDSEQMLVTAVAGGNWTVQRGYNGTTAVTHAVNAVINQVSATPTSTATYPSSGFTILVGSEQIVVNSTATPTGASNPIWFVTRGTIAAHTSGLAANQITMTVASAAHFPASGTYTVIVDSEVMTVTGGQGTTTWTVTRGTAAGHTNGTTVNANTISVASAANFPSSGTYGIQIDNEQMTVTAGQGTTTWTVTRGANSTTAVSHTSGTMVHPTTITVKSSTGYPATPFTVQVDSEQMTVTAESGTGNTTWTITRGVNGTSASSHNSGAIVADATIPVTGNSSFPSSGTYTIQVDNEQMTVNAGQGTNTWTVTRGVNGTNITSHSNGATTNQVSVSVTSASGFPTSGDYTVLVDSEKMLVVGGQGTLGWTVVRAVDGTSVAAHTSSPAATVATSQCQSYNGTANGNSGCDSLFGVSPTTTGELYPNTPTTSSITIANTGSIGANDLELWMPSCLRGISPDSPLASTTPAVTSFSGASSSGGHLAAGLDYYYEVTAVVGGVESVFGAEGQYLVPGSGSVNQVTLNWSAVTGATSYNVYRSQFDPNNPNAGTNTFEGGEQLLASGIVGTSYADTSNTTPTGYPPSENGSGTPLAAYVGSGNPCVAGLEFYVQETNSSGTNVQCYYPPSQGTNCSYSATYTLGIFDAAYWELGSTLLLGAGPAATSSRYFQIGAQLPSNSDNTMEGVEPLFSLHWYMSSGTS